MRECVLKPTEHGLALCYNSESIEFVEEFQMTNAIEIMACHLRSDLLLLSDFILVIIYRKPGTTASRIDGTTIHSAFTLPIYGVGIRKKKLTDQELHNYQQLYQYLKVLVIDEISMIGDKTLYDLDKYLRRIKSNDTVYGGVSILSVGDFFQLPPVKMDPVFVDKKSNYTALAPHLWKDYFQIIELNKQVRQVLDPPFAELVNRVRTGDHTRADIQSLKAMENTDTQNWPKDHTRLFLTNRLVKQFNDNALASIQSEKFVIPSTDSVKDEETNICPVTIPEKFVSIFNCWFTKSADSMCWSSCIVDSQSRHFRSFGKWFNCYNSSILFE